MGSEQQYISLYEEARDLIFQNSAASLNGIRQAAFEDFKRLGFPSRKVERYKYTDVDKAFSPNYGVNLKRLEFSVDPYKAYRCSVPNIGTALYYVVNDVFYASPGSKNVLPEGVFVGSLRQFAQQYPLESEKYCGRLASTKEDGITALNTALAQDGLVMYIPAGMKIEPTLQVVFLMRGEIDLMTNRRVMMIVGTGAEVSVLFCQHALDKGRFLTTDVEEVFVERNARLSLYAVEETTQENRFFDNIYIKQENGSKLEYCDITLRNGLTRRRLDLHFEGEDCEARLMGAVVAGGNQKVDNNLLIDHAKGNCRSDILYKYVLDGEAIGAFAGKVLVRKDAQRTNSQETNANLCVSPTARMFTQPMLEIYADDVKCNHGSTVGQIDQTALFYMAQRGIPQEEAQLLMQHAFVNEVIQQIGLAPLRERLSVMVEQRFRHALSGCGDCDLCHENKS